MTFSSDGRSMKPSRRLFEHAIDGAGCERGRILMVGDSLRADMLGGRRAGLATAWVAPDSAPLPPDAESLVDYRLVSLVSLADGIGAR
jgi:FMN phosphatase YigB (HAD superfamily)